MKRPRIGALRHRVRLEAPSHLVGEGGVATVTWQPVVTLWAEVLPISGRETVQADGVTAVATLEIRTRYRADITPEMRFVLGDRVLDIRAVRDIEGRRRWLSCVCEERGP